MATKIKKPKKENIGRLDKSQKNLDKMLKKIEPFKVINGGKKYSTAGKWRSSTIR